MTKRRIARSGRARRDSGYALILVMFLTALMLIAVTAVAPSLRTDARREKELEMIWRGKQYVRAIKLYYRKTGRFPTALDDLSKPKLGSIRFLRQAYKDPVNKEDGAWRLIYVGPAGQLIGSKKPHRTLQMPAIPAQPGSASSTPAGSKPSTSPFQGFGGGTLSSDTSPNSNLPSSFGTSQNSATGKETPDSSSDQTPTIIGGNIIGVGSKMNRTSIITYEDATNYRQFEFIWDPSKDVIAIGGAPGQSAAPGQGTQSLQPFGGPRNRRRSRGLPNQQDMPPLQAPPQ